MKFDLIIGNPPYTKGLDLHIHKRLEHCLNDNGKIVFVHPAMFLLSHKYNVGKRPGYDLDTSKLEYVKLFDGNDIFNIGLGVAMAITVWENAKSNDSVNVVDDVFTNESYQCKHDKIHPYGKHYGWIRQWMADNLDYSTNGSVGTHGRHTPETDIYIVLPIGNGSGPVMIAKGEDCMEGYLTKPRDHKSAYTNVYSFGSKVELENFVGYLKTKCVRFILSISKTNQMLFRGELNQIPWMDFTKSYSDKVLCEMWNIDEKLWKFIDEHIPDYYPDYQYGV